MHFGAITIVLVLVIPVTFSYKILLTVTGAAGSQTVFIYRLGELLADHGHDVTILRSELLPEVPVPKLMKVKRELVFTVIKDEETRNVLREAINKINWNSTLLSPQKEFSKFRTMFRVFKSSCSVLLDDKEIMAELANAQYDVIVIHMIDLCGIGLAHVLGIKSTIQISTTFSADMIAWSAGAPFPVAYLPSAPSPFSDRMTLLERLQNLILYCLVNGAYSFAALPLVDQVFSERYGSDFPRLRRLLDETQLFFINADHLIDFPRPDMPNTVYIGGFMMEEQVRTTKRLNKKWEGITNSPQSKEYGFIIFSLGTLVDTKAMPYNIKLEFFNAFRRLPQTVIWRCKGEVPKTEGTNVHVADWLPQTDLLSHPNIAAFITHGGYNSVLESSYAGVPLIVLPLFSDQFGNYQRVKRMGFGIRLDKGNLTEDHIYETLQTVLKDKRYAENAKRTAKMLARKPVSNKEQAVKWVEFLAEFKSLENLQPASRNLYVYQYFLLDVMLIVLASLAVVVYCCCKCCGICCRKVDKMKPD